MRNVLIPSLVAAAFISVGCQSSPHSVGQPVALAAPAPHTLAVEGTAEVVTAPDTFVVFAGVDTHAPDPQTAKHENDESMRKLLAVAKRFDVDTKETRTESFSLQPRYDDGRRIVGYDVHKTLVITLRDSEKVEPLLYELFEQGANRLDGLSFESSKIAAQRREARTLAVKAAREKAEAMADALGQKIGRPIKIDEGVEQAWGPRALANASFDNGTRAELKETMATGKIRIPANVSVVFEIAD